MPPRLAALAAALLLSSCASTDPTPTCEGSVAYQGPARRDVPASVWERDFDRSLDGTLPATLTGPLSAALDTFLAYVPAASVAVAIPGEGTWSATRGVADAGAGAPLPARPLFQVASVGKAFTAAVVLQLADEGRLDLRAPVARWFPDVPNAEHVTVGQLLDHTSGLVSFNALPDGRSLGPGYRTPEELVAAASEYDPLFCPGAYWSYTNTGYVLLGRIVEDVEGRPFEEVVADRVIGPLGLEDTAMRRPGVPLDGVVTGHARGVPVGEAVDYALPYAAGALASTAGDLVRFWHALLAGELVPAGAVRASFEGMYPMQPLFPAPPGTAMFYGRGVQLTDAPGGADGPGLMLEHSGGITGFNAVVAYLTEDDAYVSVAFNDKDVPAAAGLWALVRALRAARAEG